MGNPVCLIGDKFIAECMEVISNQNEYKSWNIKLKRSATCKIQKSCKSLGKDTLFIEKYKRAFEVKINEGEVLIDHQNTLLCEFSDDKVSKNVYKSHGGAHRVVPFVLKRSFEFPLVCTKDEQYSNNARVSIEPQIKLQKSVS
ncbi:hypothetical protein M1558_01955 [Candidatus Parvarchaeota archaeon]|jgi:hypothetical protein|nr:hypothetical protein [Candidatus Parvarchaeota archaeon]